MLQIIPLASCDKITRRKQPRLTESYRKVQYMYMFEYFFMIFLFFFPLPNVYVVITVPMISGDKIVAFQIFCCSCGSVVFKLRTSNAQKQVWVILVVAFLKYFFHCLFFYMFCFVFHIHTYIQCE